MCVGVYKKTYCDRIRQRTSKRGAIDDMTILARGAAVDMKRPSGSSEYRLSIFMIMFLSNGIRYVV